MKKTMCTLLVASMLLGVASCSKEKSKDSSKSDKSSKSIEIEYVETSSPTELPVETTAAPTEETIIETEPALPQEHECPVPLVNESLGNIVCDTVYLDYDGESRPYSMPHLMYGTEDAEIINNEISDLMDYIVETNDGDLFFYRADMFLYTYGDFITIVSGIHGDCDINVYNIWTINDKTGTRISNSELLSVANNHPTSIVEAATIATINFTNKVYDQGDGIPILNEDASFNPDHHYGSFFLDYWPSGSTGITGISEDMMIGIDSDGCLIYVAEIIAMGGAGSYDHLFNDDGVDLSQFLSPDYVLEY